MLFPCCVGMYYMYPSSLCPSSVVHDVSEPVHTLGYQHRCLKRSIVLGDGNLLPVFGCSAALGRRWYRRLGPSGEGGRAADPCRPTFRCVGDESERPASQPSASLVSSCPSLSREAPNPAPPQNQLSFHHTPPASSPPPSSPLAAAASIWTWDLGLGHRTDPGQMGSPLAGTRAAATTE